MKSLNFKKKRTAVILCGGRGTRLGSITKKIPKSLVKIKNKPIIWYILNILKKNHFNHFVLPIGYKGNLLKGYLKKNIFKNFDLDIVQTGVDTPIAQRISKIKNFIKSDNFLLLNGDAIFDFDLNKIYRNHEKNKNTYMTFLGSETNLPYGTIILSEGIVKNFQRNVMFNAVKIANEKNTIAHVYSGMSILKSKILNQQLKNFKNFEQDLYPLIIKKYKCKFQKFSGFWHSIDNMKDIIVLKNDNDKKKKLTKLVNKLNK